MAEPTSTRRAVLAATAALPLVAVLSRRADAAEFSYKLATGQNPTHPINVRLGEAAARIRDASNGRLEITLFPANQLGSDTDLLSQLRAGGVELFNLSTSILATLVPAAGIPNVGFAFPDYEAVWRAMDGKLGDYVGAQITKAGIVPVCRMADNGFRHVTASTHPIARPADLSGFKIRVPVAPILTSLFNALGAGATPINFNELYSALQTRIVEGQENPLAIIATTKLYEVQKYGSLTGHVWDGFWILGNRRAWAGLPDDLRKLAADELNRAAGEERADVAKLNDTLVGEMSGKGLAFNQVDRGAFRDALRQTSFYKDWQAKFGAEPWALLESYSGKLA